MVGVTDTGSQVVYMKRCQFVVLLIIAAAPCMAQDVSQTAYFCPVTLGSNSLGDPLPDSENWYGSESLAVSLPSNGKWSITGPTARIAVKLFVHSVGFEPGMERHLSVRVESLTGQPNDAVVKDVTNAGNASLTEWAMLVGIDFPSVGCWQLTLDYLGQSLTFIVETVNPPETEAGNAL